MPHPSRKTSISLALLSLLIAILFLTFRPQAQAVDFASVSHGPLQISVGDEGFARIHDVYSVSAPVAGHLLRISLRAGDTVEAGTTELARIVPSDPQFLDQRTRAQAEASLRTAQAAVSLAQADLHSAEAQLAYAQSQAKRAQELAQRGSVSQAELDQAELNLRAARAAVASAQAASVMRRAERDNAAAVVQPQQDNAQNAPIVPIRAPISGRILRVVQQSETVVAPGQLLMELGDPAQLEIVVDLLSRDAVRIQQGARVEITNWGQDQPLQGQVRRVEPFGFTKISALGVEEQRVNVIIDLTSPREQWTALHHGYRVDVAVNLWAADSVLGVPSSALFREGDGWAVFRAIDGRARFSPVQIGHRNAQTAEVLGGLSDGETVILHPAESLQDGDRVTARDS